VTFPTLERLRTVAVIDGVALGYRIAQVAALKRAQLFAELDEIGLPHGWFASAVDPRSISASALIGSHALAGPWSPLGPHTGDGSPEPRRRESSAATNRREARRATATSLR